MEYLGLAFAISGWFIIGLTKFKTKWSLEILIYTGVVFELIALVFGIIISLNNDKSFLNINSLSGITTIISVYILSMVIVSLWIFNNAKDPNINREELLDSLRLALRGNGEIADPSKTEAEKFVELKRNSCSIHKTNGSNYHTEIKKKKDRLRKLELFTAVSASNFSIGIAAAASSRELSIIDVFFGLGIWVYRGIQGTTPIVNFESVIVQYGLDLVCNEEENGCAAFYSPKQMDNPSKDSKNFLHAFVNVTPNANDSVVTCDVIVGAALGSGVSLELGVSGAGAGATAVFNNSDIEIAPYLFQAYRWRCKKNEDNSL